ncbi:hypothetical protein [Pelosinus propionicus]|uniref:Papain-like cysteine peptidase n=1 Tax=Pelosinus propionicus DSM 13327 TaxID=1123291 RepID=A0A1I4HT33_9FIRM|nr:hypothetical protein [Pelosinus propionicus]SFL45398.1 hypothetical protein SAMN04490355_100532 [Pelosinus propionicus DSM 13327]
MSYSYNKCISLGLNCEVSFQVQRSMKNFESYFLSWAFLYSFEGLLKVLAEMEKIFNCDLEPHGTNMFLIKEYSIAFHGKANIDSIRLSNGKLDEVMLKDVKDELISRQLYLADKFRKTLNSGEKILLIIKPNPGIVDVTAFEVKNYSLQIRELLSNKYPNSDFDLLVLQEEQHFETDWNEPRIFNRYISKFAPIPKANEADVESWNKIFSEFKCI